MAAKILAVDDEKHIVRLVQINLQKEGYEVITASHGQEALDRIAADKPDLVIMDVMMPQMDGFEALKTLKSQPETVNLPVIMLTAKAQDADVFEGWKSGADLYLTKPFNPSELMSFVKRILQDRDKNNDDTYEIDPSQVINFQEIDENTAPPALGLNS